MANARQYDGDKLVSKSKLFNSDVVAGSIEAIKRWTQTIAQTIKMRVENRASINRYQEVKQGISYTVNVDAPEGLNWDSADNPHADRVQYEQSSQNTLYYPFSNKATCRASPMLVFRLPIMAIGMPILTIRAASGRAPCKWRITRHTR